MENQYNNITSNDDLDLATYTRGEMEKNARIQRAKHRKNITRCNILLMLEGIVLLIMLVAYLLIYVIK